MNINKKIPKEGTSKKAIVDFFDKKGFYVVLILCIVIVGATAVFVTTHNVTSSNPDFDAENIIPEDVHDIDASSINSNDAVSQKNKLTASTYETKVLKDKVQEPIKSEQSPNTKKQAEPKKETVNSSKETKPSVEKKINEAKVQNFIMPVFGKVTFDYAQDRLVYSKTLDDWRTHSGLDIGAERGTTVKAVADGTISEIKNDPRLGVTIVVDHGNRIKTVYSNLSSGDMVSQNQKIKQGDVVGSIGSTATFECAEQSHLHFEVWKDNGLVNPKLYLTDIK